MALERDIRVVNIKKKGELIHELHSYKVIAEMNDYYFKLVKAQREFVWHRHPETDEVFVCIEGEFSLEFRTRTLHIREGEMVVVPKDVEHRPVCPEVCCIMLIEPKDTINTGTAGGTQTDTSLEWI
ncbi:MAG: cupin domain-containing protein [Methanomicrobiales archaeon]|nr:cupin domain-containing protein [Methanomicrobiales archaeon]